MASPSDNRDARTQAHAHMLENRVRKRHRHLRKWARRHRVTCYRLYDRDIPEISLAIDLYTEDSGARHLHVAYYQSREREREREREPINDAWIRSMAEAAKRALAADNDSGQGGVEPVAVHLKRRQRQRGTWQYQSEGESDDRLVVREGEHLFAVDLDNHLDTGLFLDHRPLRARIEREARGSRFLNLFCYTATITVCAASGGALASESVDLSQNYLAWAADNLARNRVDMRAHRLVRADVLEYLRRPVQGGHTGRFDLAVLDPPTFSNSKKMRGVLDVQRDHPRLIEHTLARLRPGGVLYFSTNSRRFKLAAEALPEGAEVTDITTETIPEDFRNRRIHKCWRIVRAR